MENRAQNNIIQEPVKVEQAPSEVPQVPFGQKEIISSVKGKFWKVGFLSLLVLLIIIGGVFGYHFYTQKIKEKGEKQIPLTGITVFPSPTPEIVLPQGIASGKVFYVKDNNIISYNVETKKIEKWTNYPKNKDYSPAYDESGKQIPNISIEDINVINGDTLDFGKCDVVTGDFGCGLYLLDLKTKKITQKMKLDKEDLLLDSGWFDENRFVYLVSTKKNNGRWQLYLFNNNNSNLLVDLSTEGWGRGGFIEDSEKIKFSPDGNYFFHISTGSPRSGEDFTTHIYDSSTGKEMLIIQNSTMSSWVDEARIIFRRYVQGDSPENGIYIYNLNSKTATKIENVPVDSYHPEVLLGGEKLVFWTNKDKALWLYNLQSKENKLLINKAVHGFWVTPTKIVFEEIEPCNGREDCGGMMDYEIQSVSLYNLELRQKTESIPDLQSTYETASLYHNF